MKIHRGVWGALAALVLGTGLIGPANAALETDACMAGVGTSVAMEPASGHCCVTQTNYSLSGKNTRMSFSGVPTFKNGPGGKMIVSRSYSGSVGAQVVAGAESEVGAVLARAKVYVSASLSTSNSTSSTNTYERYITREKYGNARYVSWGKDVSYRKFRINGDCSQTTLAKGRIKFPSSTEGWYYWETRS